GKREWSLVLSVYVVQDPQEPTEEVDRGSPAYKLRRYAVATDAQRSDMRRAFPH
ncbi:hypothetical protein HPB47_017650, partial [Ixodes persulcatus]